MSEKVEFKEYIFSGTLEIEPENVEKIKYVNGACSDIHLSNGETVRVKGYIVKVRDKLGLEDKSKGI